jgi:hypothetical protein
MRVAIIGRLLGAHRHLDMLGHGWSGQTPFLSIL